VKGEESGGVIEVQSVAAAKWSLVQNERVALRVHLWGNGRPLFSVSGGGLHFLNKS
jgi:hypothetical protein